MVVAVADAAIKARKKEEVVAVNLMLILAGIDGGSCGDDETKSRFPNL